MIIDNRIFFIFVSLELLFFGCEFYLRLGIILLFFTLAINKGIAIVY